MNNILYASDLDRTLIFSGRFLEEHPTECKYTPIEYKEDKIISYMADEVIDKLKEIRENKSIHFIPVTTRSINEYKRINLNVKPEYAIVANGGVILYNGEPLEEWTQYIKSKINIMDILDIINDITDYIKSVSYTPKLIDGCYIFFKTDDEMQFDIESGYLKERFGNWQFIRQRNKCYAIPNHFSKQIALRWLWNKLDKPYIIASGDSELDLPMLALANKAIIPSHGTLITEGFVTDGNIIDGGITSPLKTMDIVLEEVK